MIVRPHSATFRYRVLDSVVVHDDGSGGYGYEAREFHTLKGAEAHQRRLADRGHAALLQYGVLHWMPRDDAVAELKRLQSEGVTLE